MIKSRTLVVLDGPRKFLQKNVRKDGSTLDTVRVNGYWHMYDRVDGDMYCIVWAEVPVFVAGKGGVMFGATEIHREKYEGVL